MIEIEGSLLRWWSNSCDVRIVYPILHYASHLALYIVLFITLFTILSKHTVYFTVHTKGWCVAFGFSNGWYRDVQHFFHIYVYIFNLKTHIQIGVLNILLTSGGHGLRFGLISLTYWRGLPSWRAWIFCSTETVWGRQVANWKIRNDGCSQGTIPFW